MSRNFCIYCANPSQKKEFSKTTPNFPSQLIFTFTLLVLIVLSLTFKAGAVAKINVDSGQNDPIPIVLNTFQVNSGHFDSKLKDSIYSITVDDLESTGLFQFASRALFLKPLNHSEAPNFNYWNNLDYVMFANIALKRENGKLSADVKLWNTALAKLALQKKLYCNSNNPRKLGHKIADLIYTHLTGDVGYFNSRVAFVTEFGSKNNIKKKISVADYDGKNVIDLTNGNFLVLTPRFAPNDDYVMYVSYEHTIPRVYIQKIAKHSKRKLVGEFAGMSFAPRFHPSGKNGIMSISSDEGTHLFEINFNNNKLRRLTWGKDAIDTSPSYSPDGSKVVYSSDRSGSLQLYVMNMKTGKSKRVSFGGGGYAAPAWSPRGDMIAFTKYSGGQFHIGVVKPDGEGERLLTSSWMEDSPTWSPNGRAIMFAREEKHQDKGLYIVDAISGRVRKFHLGVKASDPCWDYDND